ncbi:RodZ domain-containing protein [Sagittula sp. S175]|uniref:helix-turn-helix domain-containing protein n=1 Tax=Sagittula sp. S175 TaxID=3415129 RepID=UPI003C7AEDAA
MIGRKSQNRIETTDSHQGSEGFTLKLGDVMRGERATMGKSLLDVQRELRIKASYIAAIENCDPSAFDTPGFIAGYVRSYARYLGMDPDEAFAGFCEESGFSVAHGMSSEASVVARKPGSGELAKPRVRNALAEPNLPFAPASDSWMSQIEPRAIGSSLVLLALIGGIGYGGWAVLQEVQRVQVTPVDQTPVVLSELDPLDAARRPLPVDDQPVAEDVAGVFTPPSTEAFDRLYRPQALDVPVLVARDEPISTLDPDSGGLFAGRGGALPSVQDSSLAAAALAEGLIDQAQSGTMIQTPVIAGSGVTVLAVRPSWVQIKDEEGNVLLSHVMNAGETYAVPRDAMAAELQAGESGAVYFTVDGQTYGPAGARGSVTQGVSLAAADLTERYSPAQPGDDDDLMTALVAMDLQGGSATTVAEAPRIAPSMPDMSAPRTAAPQIASTSTDTDVQAPAGPRVLADAPPGITVVATAETWVEVTSPSGKKLFAQTLQAGQTYQVPQTDQPATIFSGNAGGVFFAVNGQTFGPYGQNGQFGRNLALSAEAIQQELKVADLTQNQTLARVVAELRLASPLPGR